MGKENAMKFFGITLCTMLLALTACSSGGDPVVEDWQMWECEKHYEYVPILFLFEWSCKGGVFPASNQPIFTSEADCETAIRLRQRAEPNTWDETDEAKTFRLNGRGIATFLWCEKL